MTEFMATNGYPMTVQSLARQDHKANRFKSGVAIAATQGMNWRDLDDQEAQRLVNDYKNAWWAADRKAAA